MKGGLCNAHYIRKRLYGDVLADKPLQKKGHGPLIERIWAHVNKDGPVPAFRPDLGSCWLWEGALNKGYAVLGGDERGMEQVHRVTYKDAYGVLPPGDLDHLCRVRNCVRPSHLEPVTRKENNRRGLNGVLKTTCKNGHAWIPENIYTRRNGVRRCRICTLETNYRSLAKRLGH